MLTSNGGNAHASDVGWDTGNHHRWWQGAEQHVQTVASNFAAYSSDGSDSHPTAAGLQKATQEFVPLLNAFYHRWKGTPCAPTPTATGTVTQGIKLYLPIILKGYSSPGRPTP